jgi:hypothetical protein
MTMSKPLPVQFGTADSADFEAMTWTFQMPEGYRVFAGPVAIVPIETYRELLEALERYVDLDVQADKDEGVSIRCDSGLHGAAVAALRKATNGVQEVGINGLTEAETNASASVMGVVLAKHFDPNVVHEWPGPDGVDSVYGGQR